MNPIKKLIQYRQQTQQRKSFIYAIGKYFLDVAFNKGERTRWILEDIEAHQRFCVITQRDNQALGTQAAIKIINKYRELEGKQWNGQ